MNTMTMTPPVDAPSAQRWSVGRWAARIGRVLLYVIISFVLGTLGFSVVLTLLALGAGTAVIWIGLPILVGAVLTARGFAAAGRTLGSSLLGTDLPAPAPKQAPEGAGWGRRLVTPLTDPQSWLDALWILTNFLLSLITFPLALLWTLGSIAVVGGPVSALVLDRTLPNSGNNGLGALMGFTGQSALAADIAVQFAAGLFFLLTVGLVMRDSAPPTPGSPAACSAPATRRSSACCARRSPARPGALPSPPHCVASSATCTTVLSSAWSGPRWTWPAPSPSPPTIPRRPAR